MLRKSCVIGIMISKDFGQELAYKTEEYKNLDECIRKNATKRNLKLINNCSRNISSRRIRKEVSDVEHNSKKMFLVPSEKLTRFLNILDDIIQEPNVDYLEMAS